MRVVFCGTSGFAVPSLEALAASSHTVVAVVTQPDRPGGRGMQLQESPIKRAAKRVGIEILQPEKVRRAPFPAQLAALAPDVLAVVSFGQIIPQRLLDLPPFGGINVHASLLPRWRGAAPIHWALLAGDAETGVATMRMEASLDTGPVFLEHREPIRPDDTVIALEPRLAEAGARLLVTTLDRLTQEPDWEPTAQAADGMTYASMIDRATGFLDPASASAAALERAVRALSPRPGAWLVLAGKDIKVLGARGGDALPDALPGTIATIGREGIGVATIDGTLWLTVVQPAGKPAMPAADYANGARLRAGDPAVTPAL